ncbi:hypothetical protein LEP1GSC179_2828 [Leptospira santarosai str. MOR084]|uniref:Uncharacterized protein n=1 Tax=Leptospira santarosai str. MOR084 TaxID=1049984 RepID=A0A0E2BEL6_9LEPT|nr:hypothetical protein LEP1GSC179_2828 [Leptospira santarosai str. MOR084]
MAHRIIVGFRFCSDRFAKSGRGKRDKYNSFVDRVEMALDIGDRIQ